MASIGDESSASDAAQSRAAVDPAILAEGPRVWGCHVGGSEGAGLPCGAESALQDPASKCAAPRCDACTRAAHFVRKLKALIASVHARCDHSFMHSATHGLPAESEDVMWHMSSSNEHRTLAVSPRGRKAIAPLQHIAAK